MRKQGKKGKDNRTMKMKTSVRDLAPKDVKGANGYVVDSRDYIAWRKTR